MRARSTNQEDYLLRLIKEAAAALRLLRHKLAGTADAPESVREQAAYAILMLLGPRSAMLERLDAMSAVHLVGHPEHVELWAALLEVEGAAARASGDESSGAALCARAHELRQATARLWSGPGQ